MVSYQSYELLIGSSQWQTRILKFSKERLYLFNPSDDSPLKEQKIQKKFRIFTGVSL